MKRIAEQAPSKEATRIVELLRELGFNEQLLGSERYALEKLQSLDGQDMERIRQAFVKYSHPRFMKAFSYHLPYGQKQAYRNEIEKLTLEKMAYLIKICGFLMQTKVYLFWKGKTDGQAGCYSCQPKLALVLARSAMSILSSPVMSAFGV